MIFRNARRAPTPNQPSEPPSAAEAAAAEAFTAYCRATGNLNRHARRAGAVRLEELAARAVVGLIGDDHRAQRLLDKLSANGGEQS